MSSPATVGRPSALTPQQVAYLQEWRDLCYTLEKAQGDELCHHCHDKFQFAKTFSVFGREFERAADDVRHRVGQGNFSFFSERGIPGDVMTPTLAERMLDDWRHAIDAKRGHLEIVFRSKFGQTIDECLRGEENAVPLNLAESLERADAVTLLSDFAHDKSTPCDLGPLENRVEQIKSQLAYLNEAVARADPPVVSELTHTVRQLRADVDRILARLDLGDG